MSDDSTQGGAEPSPASAGSQPVAWAVWSPAFGYPFGDAAIFKRNELAVEMCAMNGYGVDDIVPLYRQPTLSDEEFGAMQWAAYTLCVGWDDLKPDDRDRSRKAADTLRRMVARLS